jgi:hypothetical protein
MYSYGWNVPRPLMGRTSTWVAMALRELWWHLQVTAQWLGTHEPDLRNHCSLWWRYVWLADHLFDTVWCYYYNWKTMVIYTHSINSLYDMTRICHLWICRIWLATTIYNILLFMQKRMWKGMQSNFSMPFLEQKGNNHARPCLIASRKSYTIWDSAT